MANPLGLCACQQAGLSPVRLLTAAEAARSAELGSGGVTPLLGTSSWTGTAGGGCGMGLLAAWAQLRWPGGSFQIWVPGVFEAPRWALETGFQSLTPWIGHPIWGLVTWTTTTTGDLGKQTPL